MSAKHSPAPWRIGTPPPNGEQTIGTEQGLMVAVATTGVSMKADETLANARLIAAAPDLLEALEELLSAPQLSGEVSFNLRLRIEKARAAIAKATGEQA